MKSLLNALILASEIISFCAVVNANESALRVGLPASSITLDPTGVQDQASLWVSRQIQCQLIRGRGRNIEKEAAEEIEFVGPKEIKFTIRKDLKFADGTPVTADDVIASINFLKRHRRIHRYILAGVESVRKVGPWSILVKLKKANPPMLNMLGLYSNPIFQRSFLARAERDSGVWNHSVGCGAYKLEPFTGKDTVIHLDPINGGRPIDFVLEGDPQSLLRDANSLDIFPMPLDDAALPKGFREERVFDPYQIFLSLNTKRSPWNNREARCSLFSKLDFRSAVASYGLEAKTANDLFPSGTLGYSEDSNFAAHPKKPSIEGHQSSIPNNDDHFCLSFLSVSVPGQYRPYYEQAITNIFTSTSRTSIENPERFGDQFLRSGCDGLIFGRKSNNLDGFEYLAIFTAKDDNPSGFIDQDLSRSIMQCRDISDTRKRAEAYREIANNIRSQCILYPILTIPYKKIWIKEGLLTPGIGEVSLNSYPLGGVQ